MARYVATTREEYARILERFLELTGKKDPTTQLFIGYHTRIIHIGERLDTIIPNPDNRRNVFEELDGHIRSIIDHMIAHSQLDFAEYRRHRFPPVIIQHAVWLHLRFTLSYRDVGEPLAERGSTSLTKPFGVGC